MGRDHGGPARAVRAAPPAARDDGADAAGARAVPRLPRRPGRAGVGALGGQPEHPLGLVHARRPARSGSPTGCRAMPAGWSTTCCVHELAHLLEPGHNARFWAWVDRYPQAERAKGYLEGWSRRGRDGPRRPAATATERGLPATPRRREPRSARRMSGSSVGQASTGHQRTSSDSSLTAGSAPRRARREEPDVEVVDRRRAGRRTSTACSSRCTGSGSSDEAGEPGLLGAPRAARPPARVASPARGGRRSGTSAGPCACRLSSTWPPVGGDAPGRRR